MTPREGSDHTQPISAAVTIANVVYALHAAAIVVGIAGSPTVVGSFVGSVPSIVGVILNYAKRGEARGSWVESHYRWQIRTFWFALVWFLLGLLLAATIIGIPITVAMFVAIAIWVVYRVGRGWLRLRNQQPMYA